MDADQALLQDGKTYNAWRAYGAAKTANILFTYALSKRLSKKGVAILAVHPGGKILSKTSPCDSVSVR